MKINRRIHNHISISVKANTNFAKSILGLSTVFIFYDHITLVTVKTKNLKSIILMGLLSLMLLIIIIV